MWRVLSRVTLNARRTALASPSPSPPPLARAIAHKAIISERAVAPEDAALLLIRTISGVRSIVGNSIRVCVGDLYGLRSTQALLEANGIPTVVAHGYLQTRYQGLVAVLEYLCEQHTPDVPTNLPRNVANSLRDVAVFLYGLSGEQGAHLLMRTIESSLKRQSLPLPALALLLGKPDGEPYNYAMDMGVQGLQRSKVRHDVPEETIVALKEMVAAFVEADETIEKANKAKVALAPRDLLDPFVRHLNRQDPEISGELEGFLNKLGAAILSGEGPPKVEGDSLRHIRHLLVTLWKRPHLLRDLNVVSYKRRKMLNDPGAVQLFVAAGTLSNVSPRSVAVVPLDWTHASIFERASSINDTDFILGVASDNNASRSAERLTSSSVPLVSLDEALAQLAGIKKGFVEDKLSNPAIIDGATRAQDPFLGSGSVAIRMPLPPLQVLSHSLLASLANCPLQFVMKDVLRLTSPRRALASASGIALHQLMEHLSKRAKKKLERVSRLVGFAHIQIQGRVEDTEARSKPETQGEVEAEAAAILADQLFTEVAEQMTPKNLPKKERKAKLAEEKEKASVSPVVLKKVKEQAAVAKKLIDTEEKAVKVVKAEETTSEYRFHVYLKHPRRQLTVRLHGRVDELEETEEGAVITEMKQWRGSADASTHRQLLLYAMAYHQKHRKLPARLVLRGLSDNTPISTYSPTLDDLSAVLDRLWALFDYCSEGLFVARPSPPACARCNFATLCPAAARALPQFNEKVVEKSKGVTGRPSFAKTAEAPVDGKLKEKVDKKKPDKKKEELKKKFSESSEF